MSDFITDLPPLKNQPIRNELSYFKGFRSSERSLLEVIGIHESKSDVRFYNRPCPPRRNQPIRNEISYSKGFRSSDRTLLEVIGVHESKSDVRFYNRPSPPQKPTNQKRAFLF
jgi:hypothetical protein